MLCVSLKQYEQQAPRQRAAPLPAMGRGRAATLPAWQTRAVAAAAQQPSLGASSARIPLPMPADTAAFNSDSEVCLTLTNLHDCLLRSHHCSVAC
jgi:hypothetical protein